MLECLCKAVRCRKRPDGRNYERAHVPFNCKIGLLAVFHALGVGDDPTGTDDSDLALPDDLCNGKDGAIDVGPGVPVARNQKHVFTDVNTGFVDAK